MPLWRNRLARCTYRHERDAEVVSSSLTRGTGFVAPEDNHSFGYNYNYEPKNRRLLSNGYRLNLLTLYLKPVFNFITISCSTFLFSVSFDIEY